MRCRRLGSISALLCSVFGLLHHSLAVNNMLMRSMKYTHADVKYNHKYFHNVTADARNGYLSLDMYMIRALPRRVRCFVYMQTRLKDSKHFQTLLMYDFELCKMLANVFRVSLVRTWFVNMLKYAKFIQNCPILPDYYYIHNSTLEAASIPVYLQAGDCRFVSHMYHGKRRTKHEVMMLHLTTDFHIY